LTFVEGGASMVRFHGGKEDPLPPRKTPNHDSTSIEMEELHDYEIMELSSKSSDYKLLHWPQGSRVAKEDQKNAKLKECALHVQAKLLQSW